MLDFTTILALVVAIVVFMQLRNVLGKRTGNERPPFDPYAKREGREGRERPGGRAPGSELPPREAGDEGDRVVTLRRDEDDDPYRDIDRVAPRSSDVNKGLREIRDLDPGFSPKSFLDGAKSAYEMIVQAFAEGDRDTLRMLLAPDVYDSFEAVIAEREREGHTVRSSFVGIDEAAIDSAAVRDGEAMIAVRVVSQLIQATFDKAGELVEGDAEAISEVRDVWTFARPVGADDPNWKLVATEPEE